MAPRLRTTFAWTLGGNVVYAGCQWGMISVLAKLGSAAAVGQFALALAITAPVFMLTNLFLRGIQATDAGCDFVFGEYFTLRIVGTSVALVFILIALSSFSFGSLSWGVVLFIAAAKSVESLTDVIAGLLQRHERLDQVSISMMLKGCCSLLAFSLAFTRWGRLTFACAALALTWLAVFVAYDLRVANKLLRPGENYLIWTWKRLWTLAKLAAPVGIVMALVSLNGNIPRYAVERFRGSSELGIFAALSYLVVVAGVIVNALGQSVIARLARSFAAGDLYNFVMVLKRMCLLGIGSALLGMLLAAGCGRTALQLIYGPEYASHLFLLVIMVAISGVTAVASFLGYGMSAARHFREQLPVTILSVATCGISAYVLTSRWGLTGAAAAVLLAGCAQILGSLTVLTRAIRIRTSDRPNTEEFGSIPPLFTQTGGE